MTHCLDHPVELRVDSSGASSCPRCNGWWVTEFELHARLPGLDDTLRVETRPRSGARSRLCPECERVLTPFRIGAFDAWVYRCVTCDRTWVDSLTQRTAKRSAQSAARQQAYASLAPEERRELAHGLAEAVAAEANAPTLSLGQRVLAAVGVPMLERIEGNRVPWLTWVQCGLVVAIYALGLVRPTEWGVEALGFRAGDDALGLWPASVAHFDVFHLLGNLAFLFAFGDAAEQRLKRVWLVFAAMVLGPLSLWFEAQWAPPDAIIAGASGSVLVLVGVSVVLQPRARLVMHVFVTIVRVPLWVFGVLTLAYQAFMATLGAPGVAWFAHVAGLVSGILLGVCARLSPGLFAPVERAVFEP